MCEYRSKCKMFAPSSDLFCMESFEVCGIYKKLKQKESEEYYETETMKQYLG